MSQLRIAKQFYSLQGEGDLSGTPMYFVRTSGCSISHCPLHPANDNTCDTDWAVKQVVDIEELAAASKASGAHWLCVTGGEPSDQMAAITELAAIARQNGQRTMIQTSGVRELPDCWDWIVVSPKQHFLKNQQKAGHELKLIWTGQDFGYLRAMATQTRFLRHYLQPLCLPSGETNLKQVADVVLRCGELGLPYRLGVQQHKLWGGE